jgi:hypothetical protein
MNMESLAETLEYEDQIDPETGEFYPVEFIDLEPGEVKGAPQLTPDHLPKLARRITHDMIRLQKIEEFRDAEIARIKECCDSRISALRGQIYYCTDTLAKSLVPPAGVELPGLGRFKFRKGREYVDDEAYQKMTPEEKTRVQTQQSGCFKHKTTITPDKTIIKARLEDFKGGRSEADVDGFEIKRHPETFEFKPEQEI